MTIRNLPNDASTEDIVGYLEIAGPIKSHRFLKEEERCKSWVIQTAPLLCTMMQNLHNSAERTSTKGILKAEPSRLQWKPRKITKTSSKITK